MKIKVTGGPSGIRYKVTLDFRGYDDENFSDSQLPLLKRRGLKGDF